MMKKEHQIIIAAVVATLVVCLILYIFVFSKPPPIIGNWRADIVMGGERFSIDAVIVNVTEYTATLSGKRHVGDQTNDLPLVTLSQSATDVNVWNGEIPGKPRGVKLIYNPSVDKIKALSTEDGVVLPADDFPPIYFSRAKA